jgi:hypothetical protein
MFPRKQLTLYGVLVGSLSPQDSGTVKLKTHTFLFTAAAAATNGKQAAATKGTPE